MTETNLVVLTGCCDLETIAHAILAIKPLYLDGDTWMHKDKCDSLANSPMIELRNNLVGTGLRQLYQTDSGNGALMLATLLENSPDDRALVEEYVKAASLRFGVPCRHEEKIKPPTPGYSDTIIKIDDAVFNPARLVSTCGVMKRKDKDIHLSYILDSPGQLGLWNGD